ncbi:MAG: hypothetical protein O7A06_06855 [Acidobacteria bacterium]|nr:hypothetical protein [Acidobacteriota bacterium]MCZ6753380.1 hypothetical protein [Acidobacteriota bacterium]
MRCVICLLLFAEALAAQTFPVVLKKRLWPDGGGQIEITEQAIVYRAEKEPESRTWNYPDIQFFDRISSREFTILTYEDQRWKLGRDRQFHFTITEGELTDALFQTIRSRLDKPAANRVIPRLEAVEYEVAVKHLHTFGGCEGTLRFTEDAIAYVTEKENDAREWSLAREVRSVWSADRYRLQIHVYEDNRREFSRTRVFRFALKEPLDGAYYRRLKLRLYDLESAHLPM